MGDPGRLLSIGEAAKRLGVPASTLRGWADRGLIAAVRTPTGHRRFDPTEIERFWQDKRLGPRSVTKGERRE